MLVHESSVEKDNQSHTNLSVRERSWKFLSTRLLASHPVLKVFFLESNLWLPYGKKKITLNRYTGKREKKGQAIKCFQSQGYVTHNLTKQAYFFT